MTVTYEWVVEELDEDDIIDVNHFDTYENALAAAPQDGTPYQIALVRDAHNNVDGALDDRTYAYVSEGKLPRTFDNGMRIPDRFHI